MQHEDKIPTSTGYKSVSEIVNSLTYISYKLHRDEGVSHESLIRIGLGNDTMKAVYERGVN